MGNEKKVNDTIASMKELGRCVTVPMNVDKLIPAEYNPRHMGENQRRGLSSSIDRFGLVQPIVWNKKTGNIVGGHQRLVDLKSKGVKTTDVVVVTMNEDEEKALNIALNYKGIQGEFLEGELSQLLKDINDDDLIDDLNLTELTLDDEWEDDLVGSNEEVMPAPAKIQVTIPNEHAYIKEELLGNITALIQTHYEGMNIEASIK